MTTGQAALGQYHGASLPSIYSSLLVVCPVQLGITALAAAEGSAAAATIAGNTVVKQRTH